MILDRIEWDEYNLDHATKRLTAAEIEQALRNAERMRVSRRDSSRGKIASVTDGGKTVVIIVALVRDGVRPITGWES